MFDKLLLNAACQQQHDAVLKKGFEPQPIGVNLMLITSELSEALEADRHNRHADFAAFENETPKVIHSLADDAVLYVLNDRTINKDHAQALFKRAFEKHIKDSVEDEIADAFLRLMDLCGEYGIDIERHIRAKATYNTLREPKHGKAY